MDPKFHYPIQKIPTLDLILSQMIPLRPLTPYFQQYSRASIVFTIRRTWWKWEMSRPSSEPNSESWNVQPISLPDHCTVRIWAWTLFNRLKGLHQPTSKCKILKSDTNVFARVISKEMHRKQYLQNRTPDVRESVIVLHCSPHSVEWLHPSVLEGLWYPSGL